MTQQKDSPNINDLTLLENNAAAIRREKNQVNQAITELDTAADHLEGTEKPMRLIGNILVNQPKEDIESHIQERQNKLRKRLERLTKTQENIEKQIEELRQKVVDKK